MLVVIRPDHNVTVLNPHIPNIVVVSIAHVPP
jgi:hypothetical protein